MSPTAYDPPTAYDAPAAYYAPTAYAPPTAPNQRLHRPPHARK